MNLSNRTAILYSPAEPQFCPNVVTIQLNQYLPVGETLAKYARCTQDAFPHVNILRSYNLILFENVFKQELKVTTIFETDSS